MNSHSRALSKATIQRAMGLEQEGIDCCERAIDLDASSKAAWNFKGNALSRIGRFADAVPCFEKVLSLDPGWADVWMRKALAEDRLNHVKEALRCYQQFLDLTSDLDAEAVAYARQRIREGG